MEKTALELKAEGNKALQAGSLEEAIKFYTEAIKLDPSNHVLYSNRSAAYAKMDKYTESLSDAEKTININAKWPKGYSRKGAALAYLKKYTEAIVAYEKGLELDPNNQQIKDGLEDCRSKMGGKRMSPFSDPNLMARLALDPRTRDFMKDPEYLKMIVDLQSNNNPAALGIHLNDSRMLTTLSVLLGMELGKPDADMESEPSSPPPKTSNHESFKKNDTEEMEVDFTNDLTNALEEKEKGNVAYKKKQFDEALSHYNKAIELDPTNITFLNNKAAVFYEMKNFTECIKVCENAIEVGRENKVDFKLIAKSMTRIGNAYKNLEDFDNARLFYQKSLSEHRTPESKEALSKMEKLIKETDRLAYVNPEKAEEERENGNECFKNGQFPAAIKHYTEAIKRNPDDAKLYSNRAACYTKLAEFNLGLKDCDECIKLDPKFIKGYIRKGKILQGTKQYSKAQSVYQQAIGIDANSREAADGFRECMMASDMGDSDEVRKRAMADPEVQQILKDPAMRMILEQMQSDPRALTDHLKNPEVASKIQKLLQSGLISIR